MDCKSTLDLGQLDDFFLFFERYTVQISNSPLSILEWDTKLALNSWQGEAEKMFGWKESEMVGLTLNESGLIHSEDLTDLQTTLQSLADGSKKSNVAICRSVTRHGEEIYSKWHNCAVKNKKGQPELIISQIENISHQKIYESSLANQQQRYDLLFDNSPVGIFVTTSRGMPLKVNLAMAEMLGHESSEAALKAYQNLGLQLYVDPHKRQEFVDKIRKNKTVTNFEYEAYRADGSTIWISMTARSGGMFSERDFIINGFAVDITDKVRSRELLLNAKKIAESANRTKSDFLASMSTEFRPPLKGITKMLLLLKKTETTEDQSEYINIIRKETDRLNKLLGSILKMAELDAGKPE